MGSGPSDGRNAAAGAERARELVAGLGPGERVEFEMVLVRRCPRYDKCSVPKCPLDPLYEVRSAFSDEEKCGVAKVIRERIVAEATAEGIETVKYIPAGGLTPKEAAGRKLAQRQAAELEALPEAEKEARREKLRQQMAKINEAKRSAKNPQNGRI